MEKCLIQKHFRNLWAVFEQKTLMIITNRSIMIRKKYPWLVSNHLLTLSCKGLLYSDLLLAAQVIRSPLQTHVNIFAVYLPGIENGEKTYTEAHAYNAINHCMIFSVQENEKFRSPKAYWLNEVHLLFYDFHEINFMIFFFFNPLSTVIVFFFFFCRLLRLSYNCSLSG